MVLFDILSFLSQLLLAARSTAECGRYTNHTHLLDVPIDAL